MIRARALTPFALACACLLGAATPQSAPQAPPAQAPGAICLPGPKGAMADPGQWLTRMAGRLELSEAQRASCKAILDRHLPSLQGVGAAVAEARRDFHSALGKADTAPATLKSLHDSLAALEFDRLMEQRTLRQELHAVLTPEQREQAARLEGRQEGLRMARNGMRHGLGRQRGDAVPALAPAPAAP